MRENNNKEKHLCCKKICVLFWKIVCGYCSVIHENFITDKTDKCLKKKKKKGNHREKNMYSNYLIVC